MVAAMLEDECNGEAQMYTVSCFMSPFCVVVTSPAWSLALPDSGNNSLNHALNLLSPLLGLSETKQWQATKIILRLIKYLCNNVPAMQIINTNLIVLCPYPKESGKRMIFKSYLQSNNTCKKY